jgi:uncharacterized damage-inducible protein DinB
MPPSRARELSDAIARAVSGPIWHGPSLTDLVGDVSAEDAAAHPIAGAHSIWELVLHMASWAEIVRARLIDASTPEEDWPPLAEATPEHWRDAVERLKAAHRELADDVLALDDARLFERVSGRDYTALTMLHGVVEHDAYHGGQIAVLKRALETPERR